MRCFSSERLLFRHFFGQCEPQTQRKWIHFQQKSDATLQILATVTPVSSLMPVIKTADISQ